MLPDSLGSLGILRRKVTDTPQGQCCSSQNIYTSCRLVGFGPLVGIHWSWHWREVVFTAPGKQKLLSTAAVTLHKPVPRCCHTLPTRGGLLSWQRRAWSLWTLQTKQGGLIRPCPQSTLSSLEGGLLITVLARSKWENREIISVLSGVQRNTPFGFISCLK